MLSRIKNFIRRKNSSLDKIHVIHDFLINRWDNDLKSPKINLGQIQSFLNNQKPSISSLDEVEFQVFSQWGDDGIIQYLVNKLDIPNKVFVEFGVENYRESNTRFLLINNKWSGLVIDGSKENIEYIKADKVSWSNDLHAMHSFITKKNINVLIESFIKKGYPNEIGILSIDIDGNDYWIWQEINVVNPVIVIVEYNSVFGSQKPWTIPYEEEFYRLRNNKTYQYWGASLRSLCLLAEQKGYGFIGCNSNGNNAYFIRKDKVKNFKLLSSEEGFVEASFREYSGSDGERVGGKKRLELIRGMKIYNVETQSEETI